MAYGFLVGLHGCVCSIILDSVHCTVLVLTLDSAHLSCSHPHFEHASNKAFWLLVCMKWFCHMLSLFFTFRPSISKPPPNQGDTHKAWQLCHYASSLWRKISCRYTALERRGIPTRLPLLDSIIKLWNCSDIMDWSSRNKPTAMMIENIYVNLYAVKSCYRLSSVVIWSSALTPTYVDWVFLQDFDSPPFCSDWILATAHVDYGENQSKFNDVASCCCSAVLLADNVQNGKP